ncbi:hypothetical protein GCM10027418_07750 [Mariniluteicoccus endophyticus]
MSDGGRGEHRLVCSQLPDGRPALVANVDVDTHPVTRTPSPGPFPHAAPLEDAGWARWPDAPRVVGWTDPDRTTVVTRLGEWTFAGDPAWWDLVRTHGQVAVLVLLDRHVDAWGGAGSYAEIAGWLDSAVLYAGLCDTL